MKIVSIGNDNVVIEQNEEGKSRVMDAVEQMADIMDGMAANEIFNCVTFFLSYAVLILDLPKQETEDCMKRMSLAVMHEAFKIGDVDHAQ